MLKIRAGRHCGPEFAECLSLKRRIGSKPVMSILKPLLAALIGVTLTLASAAQAEDSPAPAAATADNNAAETPAEAPKDFAGLLAKLPDADYSEKRDLLEAMIALHHPNTRAVLTALLEEHLYSRDADSKIFIADEQADGLHLSDPLTMAPAGTVASDDGLTKIGTNNSLRKYLRGAVARFKLDDPSRKVRLDAVHEMLRDADDATIALLRERLGVEKDSGVRKEIEAGLALADLDSPDADTRLAAAQSLSGTLDGDAYNRLKTMITPAADGSYPETDARVRLAATTAVDHIQHWRSFYGAIETLFFGLSLGSVLVLAAIGLAITFGVMGVINMAHGELIMIGAYTAYVMQQLMPNHLAASILLSIPAAFVVSALVGIAIERSVVRFLYGRPLETLLATFGVSLILQQTVRSIFSPLNRSVASPDFLSGTLVINDALSITYNRLYIVLFTLIVFVILQLILKRTPLGLKVRAVSQNRAMARAMGIRSEWVDAITFGLGSGIAGVAGVALSQLTNVGPNLGQGYIIDSFMVVVFGGVGNLWGTLIGGMSLGVANKLLEPEVGAVTAKIIMLIFIILFIQRRKQGLFPQKGRAAEGH
jgi:urea transport system permease protein